MHGADTMHIASPIERSGGDERSNVEESPVSEFIEQIGSRIVAVCERNDRPNSVFGEIILPSQELEEVSVVES